MREIAPQVLAAMMRRFSDFADSEDAVQEALIAASENWPRDGLPENPKGWLFRVACRRMIDFQRSDEARRRRESEVALETQPAIIARSNTELEEDDTLALLFMCCHPALTPASAIALTLRAIAGLTTAEIAYAFMVPEGTMAQRISRAKQSVKASAASIAPPTDKERNVRLSAVLHILYLLFSEGYASSSGPLLQRPDLSNEAIRLTRMLLSSLPENPEVMGLLSLMLLTDVRRETRVGCQGELIPLTKQDRTKWDRTKIAEGVALLEQALAKGAAGLYQLQAAIAALHDEAETAEDTDWPQILALYELLGRMSDNPMIRLNYAVAVGMVNGPTAGLKLLAEIEADGQLLGHHRMDSVRANLLELAGDRRSAIIYYRTAADRATNIPERNYLITQAARLSEEDSAH